MTSAFPDLSGRRCLTTISSLFNYKGWSGIKNGELLRRVAAEFDIFVTSDQNLRYQQNLSQFEIALVVLPSNQVPAVKAVLPEIDEALKRIKPSELIEI